MKHRFRILAGTCLLACTLGAHPKVAKDLEKHPKGSKVDVIVQYRAELKLVQETKGKLLGGVLKSKMKSINAIAYNIRVDELLKLAEDPDVKYISPDRSTKAKLDFANPTVNATTALKAGYLGSGVTIA